ALRLADATAYGETGEVDFVDNQVDPTTGTVAVRARFPNPDGTLLPGQYVTVLVKKNEPKIMPVVPQAAVLTSQEGRSVLVVDAENKATPRPITIGPTVGTMWAVESGLQAGEKIIVQGIQKVRPGQVVEPVAADGQEN
ncbi:MAG TPA: efflux RND transporter periplasmic adaptor subunit, partial [Pseudodesulfovibrio sp.]|nr:efflux RND transporter periplasmic adaptor subunit [Pseudodesulfovibrio sp.]